MNLNYNLKKQFPFLIFKVITFLRTLIEACPRVRQKFLLGTNGMKTIPDGDDNCR